MRKLAITLASGLIGLSTIAAAHAQTSPYAKRGAAPRDAYGSLRQQAAPRSRSMGPYSVQDDFSGTIRWNTPNADGNFGGPGGGGSAGSSGG